jgi:L-lactate dehydrogenase (cytochrome)
VVDTEVCFPELYVHPDRKKSENVVKKVEKLGYQAIMLTVDTTILGKRENDMRTKALSAVSTVHFAPKFMS